MCVSSFPTSVPNICRSAKYLAISARDASTNGMRLYVSLMFTLISSKREMDGQFYVQFYNINFDVFTGTFIVCFCSLQYVTVE